MSLSMSVRAFLSLVLLASSYSALPQAPPGPRPQEPSRLAKWAPKANETYVSYWTVEAGWSTVLEVRNNLRQRNVTVTPVLRTADGTEIALAPVTLSSEQVLGIDLRQALSAVAPQLLDKPGSFGSAICRFNSNDSTNVFASTIVQHQGTPISFHFDESDIDGKPDQETIETIWWLPAASSTDVLVLANVSAKPLSAVVTATDASGHSYSQTVNLLGGQTGRLDVRNLTRQSEAANTIGGLTVTIAEGAGSLIASHFVYDDTTGASAIMKTFERDPSETPDQHTLRAPMLALATPDPTLGFPPNVTLEPELMLRNTTAQAIDVSVALNWRSASDSGQITIPSGSLNGGDVRILNLAGIAAKNAVPGNAYWGMLTVTYQGRYGDIVPIASSFDVSGKYGMQTPFEEGLQHLWKGSMWHVDSMRKSIITTGNGGTQSTKAAITLFYNNGKNSYTIEQVLQPGQQIWADVASIIRNQVPDKNGSVIPLDVVMGSYELRDIDHPAAGQLFEGKLVIDKTWGHGYYGCAICCGYGASTTLNPNPYNDLVGNGTWNSLWAYNVCTSSYDDLADSAYNWASDNASVATVANAYTGLVGVGGTNARASVQFQSNHVSSRCPMLTSNPFAPVSATTPQISSVSPPSIVTGSTGVLTISGTNLNLLSSPSINFDGVGISTNSVRVQSSTTITANYSALGCPLIETQNLSVSSPGTYTGTINTNSLPISITFPPVPSPDIVFEGSVVTGQTQNVIVGQQIALTASVPSPPACTGDTSQAFSLPTGSAIGGYTNANGSGIPDTTGGQLKGLPTTAASSYTFYWVDSGNGRQMSYQYVLSGGGMSAFSPVATTTFNVDAPSGASANATINPVGIHLRDGDPALEPGNYPSPVGISFSASNTYLPSGNSGNYSWVQLIKSDRIELITGSSRQSCVPNGFVNSNNPELDNTYPYTLPTLYTATSNDSPATFLGSMGENERTRSEEILTYLLWTPNADNRCSNGTACTIPVPQGYVDWLWSGDANYTGVNQPNGTTWNLVSGNPLTSGSVSTTQSNAYPVWSITFDNGTIPQAYTCTPE